MLERSLALACLLSAAVAVAACAPDAAHLDSPGRTLIAFGDSITAGVGSEEGRAYPAILQQML